MEFNQHEINIMRHWYEIASRLEPKTLLDQQDHDLAARLPKPKHHELEADGIATAPPASDGI